MSEIIFIYKGNEIPIQCNQGEKMKNIMEKLCIKLNVTKNEIYGLYNGKLLDEELLENQIPKNENNKKIILIYKFSDSEINDKIIQISNEVICPICKEKCFMKIHDYKITLYNCKNNHMKNNILINEFNETQKINISKIICNICQGRNKGNTKKFYKCIDCKLNICPLCKLNHNNNHNIINYDKIDYRCNEHIEPYTAYCSYCKKNICINCENEHNDHNVISFGKMLKNKNEIIEKNNKLKNDIDKFKEIIQVIINILNKVIDNMDKYYEINKNIINNLNNKNRNYEILYNINNIYNNNIHNDIKNIINEKNINIQFDNIIKIYKSIIIKDDFDKINNIDDKNAKNEFNKSNKIIFKEDKNELIYKFMIEEIDNFFISRLAKEVPMVEEGDYILISGLEKEFPQVEERDSLFISGLENELPQVEYIDEILIEELCKPDK